MKHWALKSASQEPQVCMKHAGPQLWPSMFCKGIYMYMDYSGTPLFWTPYRQLKLS